MPHPRAHARQDGARLELEAARILDPAATAYQVLDVARDATFTQIAAARTALLFRWHTDRCRHAQANAVSQKISEAFETLGGNHGNEARRASYNRQAYPQAEEGSISATLRNGSYGRVLEAMKKLPQGLSQQLPRIVVVGQESAGKSSVLERIAMRAAFPRAEGFCTRMPIRMKMMHRPHENRITVRCKHSADGQTVVLNGEPAERPFDLTGDARDVPHEFVAQVIQTFIEQIHGHDASPNSVLTDIEIEIEIRACNVPDLELVDLPGLVSMPPDVQRQTLELTRNYLRRPNTLVLCVIDGNTATLRGASILAEINSYAAARPPFSKTIVVQTKTDQMAGGPHTLARRLADPTSTLGCQPVALIPVMNRAGDGITLSDLVAAEAGRFGEWKAQEPALQGRPLGILSVLSELNVLFETHMCNEWVPEEMRKLGEQKMQAQKELDGLGAELSNSQANVEPALNQVSTKMRNVLESQLFVVPSRSQNAFPPAAHTGGSQGSVQVPAFGEGRDSQNSRLPPAAHTGGSQGSVQVPAFGEGRDSQNSRLHTAEDRIESKKQWRENTQTLQASWLTDCLIDETMKDDTLPLRIQRLRLKDEIKAYAVALLPSFLGQDTFLGEAPPDLSMANLREKLVDAAFEFVLAPFLHTVTSHRLQEYLLGHPDWCRENAEAAARRTKLMKEINAIDAACRALAHVTDVVSARTHT
eukprot:CAMPEP_0183378342 /NCGR_PEP_ID=MMETSP0164_2-20130417/124860_1 /TAXON_ID=221442 /ORGANISM="Coccolithus pelagicus ssp braarudi, Strain PLY182g" /LENGTH=701 /DNA_ID=CAMNT_0025555895 /DNA_START=141 /DNA_END=2246 /DNA_ORIENTATION=+